MSDQRTVIDCDERAAADAAAARLVAAGIGATVDLFVPPPAESPPEGPPSQDGRWVVQVLDVDHVRACEVLGLAAPEPEEPPRRELPRWVMILLIWTAAMITLPLLAFWITVNALD